MQCSKCEREIDDAMKFCPHCGNASAPDGTIGDKPPVVVIPPSQRQVSPQVRKISRLLGLFMTLAILGFVLYREIASAPPPREIAPISTKELSARLDQVFSKVLMGSKPAQIKNLQGNEFGIWLDKINDVPDIKVSYDQTANKWVTEDNLNDQVKAKIALIRGKNLSEHITDELGKKPYAVKHIAKTEFAVWLDPEKAAFSMRCNTKEQKWEPASENDSVIFKQYKNLK